MKYYLYGFISTNRGIEFGQIGFELGQNKKGLVMALPYQGLGAVVGPSPFEDFEGLNKEILVKALLSHQKTLEIVMQKQFILPCKFGTVVKEEAEIQMILKSNQVKLSKWLEETKETSEMEVVATWDVPVILNEMAQADPKIIALKQRIEKMAPPKKEQEKLSLGMKLSQKLKEKANHFSEILLKSLKKIAPSYSTHPLMNDQMVLNASFLLPRKEKNNFYKVLDKLDRRLEGKLHFRCVGPLPPYSFATVVIQHFHPDEIHMALETLGLKGNSNMALVKKAYRAKARLCHPDTHPKKGKEEFEKLNKAYQLLKNHYQGGGQSIQATLINYREA